jgi:cytochrome c oxidase cbb3-type subunit III
MSQEINETTQTKEGALLDHAYDGIQEYDNPMPRWWVWIFWATFWFALAYLFHFWIGNGVSVSADYETEMKGVRALQAKEALKQTVSEETLTKMLADSSSIEAGKAVFTGKCAACHAEKGQGLIGPNLTDSSWIHGSGKLMDIYKTVSEGVAAKGMPAWEKQLAPAELRQVVSFVGSLRGSNVPGKAAEGTAVQ